MENLRSVKHEISTSILGFAFFDTERFVSENFISVQRAKHLFDSLIYIAKSC